MMGIAALGMAVGSAAKGYMEGEKHRSDMEDAEQRRALGKIQLDEAQRKAKTRDEMDGIIAEYEKGGVTPTPEAAPTVANPSAGGITAPGAPAPATQTDAAPAASDGTAPATTTPKMGLAGPGAAPVTSAAPAAAPTPAAAPAKSEWERRQELYSRLNMMALKQASSPQELQGAMQNSLSMMKNFRDAQTDEKLAAMHDFMMTGDQAQATQMLAKAGVQLPEGTTWAVKKTPVYPGSKAMMDDVVVSSPDGKSISMNQIMMHRMKPEDFFKSNLEVAKAMNEASYHEAIIQNAKAGLANAQTQTKIMQSNAELANKRFNFEAVEKMNLNAQNQADRLAGVPKELTAKERDELSPEVVDKYDKRRAAMLGRSNAVMVTFGLNNQTATEGKELLPVHIADKATMMAAEQARDPSKNYVKVDETTGRSYVNVENRKVWVMPLAKPQDPAKPADPAASAQPGGVTPPGGAASSAAPSAPAAQPTAPGMNQGVAMPVDRMLRSTDGGKSYSIDLPQTIRDPSVSYYREIPNPAYQAVAGKKFGSRAEAQAAYEQAQNAPAIPYTPPQNKGMGISMPGPYGQAPARPAPGAPSIYADPYAWAQYRQTQGR